MPDGFSFAGSGSVQAGTIYIGVKIADLEQAIAGLKGLETQGKQVQNETAKSAAAMKNSWRGVADALVGVTAAYVGVQRAVRLFDEYAREQTAMNRIVLAAQKAQISTVGLRDAIEEATRSAIRFGQQEEQAAAAYQRLLQVTKNRAEAEAIYATALRFAAAQGRDVLEVATALAAAYDGQTRQLLPLLRGVATGTKEMATFADAMKAVEYAGKDANRALGEEQTAVFELRAEWDRFKDLMANSFAPTITAALNEISRALRSLMGESVKTTAEAEGKLMQDWLRAKYPEAYKRALAALQTGAAAGGGGEESFETFMERWRKRMIREQEQAERKSAAEAEADDLAKRKKLYEDWLEDYVRMNQEAERDREQMMEAIDNEWQKRNQMKLNALQELASLTAETFVSLPTQGLQAWQRLGEGIIAMLQRLLAKLIEMRLYSGLLSLFGLARMPSGSLTPGVDFSGGSPWLAGLTPLPSGGGTTIVLSGSSRGILAEVWRGATIRERREIAGAMLLTGGREVATNF